MCVCAHVCVCVRVQRVCVCVCVCVRACVRVQHVRVCVFVSVCPVCVCMSLCPCQWYTILHNKSLIKIKLSILKPLLVKMAVLRCLIIIKQVIIYILLTCLHHWCSIFFKHLFFSPIACFDITILCISDISNFVGNRRWLC